MNPDRWASWTRATERDYDVLVWDRAESPTSCPGGQVIATIRARSGKEAIKAARARGIRGTMTARRKTS